MNGSTTVRFVLIFLMQCDETTNNLYSNLYHELKKPVLNHAAGVLHFKSITTGFGM